MHYALFLRSKKKVRILLKKDLFSISTQIDCVEAVHICKSKGRGMGIGVEEIRSIFRLDNIHKEKIRIEFDKMLTGHSPAQAMELLRLSGSMRYLIPELEETYEMKQNHYHCGTVWEHTMMVLDNIGCDRIDVRMAALLHDIGKISTREDTASGDVHFIGHEWASRTLAGKVLCRLNYPTDLIKKVQFLVLYHMVAKPWKDDLRGMKPKHLRKLQYICGKEEVFNDLLLLIDADNRAHAEGYRMENQVQLIRERSDQMKREGSALFEHTPPFNRREIMELKKIKSGPKIKECQEYLLKLAFVNPLRSTSNWTKHLIGYRL